MLGKKTPKNTEKYYMLALSKDKGETLKAWFIRLFRCQAAYNHSFQWKIKKNLTTAHWATGFLIFIFAFDHNFISKA